MNAIRKINIWTYLKSILGTELFLSPGLQAKSTIGPKSKNKF